MYIYICVYVITSSQIRTQMMLFSSIECAILECVAMAYDCVSKENNTVALDWLKLHRQARSIGVSVEFLPRLNIRMLTMLTLCQVRSGKVILKSYKDVYTTYIHT